MSWYPHATVAAVIEREGKYLMVEERTSDGIVLNQPAGHLEDNESLIEAVIRETLEETAWHFTPSAITGVYRWRHPANHSTFLRVCFKLDRYSTIYAEDNIGKKNSSPSKAFFNAHFSFFKTYFLKRGFLDGYAGLIIAFSHMATNFYKYMKLYELNKELQEKT